MSSAIGKPVELQPSDIQPLRPKRRGIKQEPAGLVIATTLQNLLTQTRQGQLKWNQEHRIQGSDRIDTLTAQSGDVRIQLQGARPLQKLALTQRQSLPSVVKDWELTLTQLSTGTQKHLNGKFCYLPSTLGPNTNPANETLPKLFRAAYEAPVQTHTHLLPILEDLTARLKAGSIGATSTYIKPNALYGPPTGIKLLQIGKQEPRLEVAKMGDQIRFTLHHGGKVLKLTEQILEDPSLYEVLNTLVAEANRKDARKTGPGLEKF